MQQAFPISRLERDSLTTSDRQESQANSHQSLLNPACNYNARDAMPQAGLCVRPHNQVLSEQGQPESAPTVCFRQVPRIEVADTRHRPPARHSRRASGTVLLLHHQGRGKGHRSGTSTPRELPLATAGLSTRAAVGHGTTCFEVFLPAAMSTTRPLALGMVQSLRSAHSGELVFVSTIEGEHF